MNKTIVKKSKASMKIKKEISQNKVKLPQADNARLTVLSIGVKEDSSLLNRELNLETLTFKKGTYKGKRFADLISSRACIGITTRKGMKLKGYEIKAVKVVPSNTRLYSSIIISKVK